MAKVDSDDHVRVPPGQDGYSLRRIWLTAEEERGYYYGFANEGLWPLCHVAHVRPVFRESDWGAYRAVNQRFADAVVAEARSADPVVLVQDYHFALLPAMIREQLPQATILTIETVDRYLEARIEHEHSTIAFREKAMVEQSLGVAGFMRRGTAGGYCGQVGGAVGVQLALPFAPHHPPDRALALDHLAQPLELPGVAIATGLAAQRLAFLRVGLLQADAHALGRTDDLVASDLHQPAVHRVGDGLLLHGRVHDHALEFSRLDGLDLDGRLDGELEQLLDTVFAQQAPETADLRGVAAQARLVVVQATEPFLMRSLTSTLTFNTVPDSSLPMRMDRVAAGWCRWR